MFDLKYELRKCTECSCSRCHLYSTPDCYVNMAIRELNRYEQILDTMEKYKTNEN